MGHAFENPDDTFSIEGYHGTSSLNLESINKEGLRPSDENLFLGDGLYCFVKGLSDNPEVQAAQWANVESWDKKKKVVKYNEFCVFYVKAETHKNLVLDLTTSDGVKIMNSLYELFQKHVNITKKLKVTDGKLINFGRGQNITPLYEIIKANAYIKLDKQIRINKKIQLRMDNCTICSIWKPNKTITHQECILTESLK